ncbi:lysis system i-spanin subunit Rz [Pseudomonas chlororaphis]|uniref:lysis system i-spanin subunit Rz n=1 Tax=Pseudomonas chlororaphis TaxID=587753 RepID=UPI002367DD4B|nr:lysis system i-spanin subunit Rz [Pseudomonas chlororaphis]WDG79133.1 lysis system i-spanin subunit Rz [Pseudomonas chlororaphis]WDG87815.1 lysis system i-spanin subunit Rz [Pseudomonas chlororaphis]
MTSVQKLLGVLVLAGLLIAVGAASAWKVQDWRYGKQLAEQARLHQDDLAAISSAAATQQRAEQDKRLALEQRLATADKSHYQELTNAQKDQARLRDRLATADLRLSVLVDAADAASGCAVPATPATGGVVHGAARARLDPSHAQRIISITDDGDRGLIALAACQTYVKEISTTK